jgi:hypothetical protein
MHAAKETLGPAAKARVAFPANIVGENARCVESGLPAQIAQRRQALHRVLTEQVSARPLDLKAPDDSA